MWVMFARAPAPDAVVWPGRRWLAALDALAWPAGWAVLFIQAPVPVGIIGPVAIALAALSAVCRLKTALWFNQRYRFTTWWVSEILLCSAVFAIILKMSTHV